MITLTTADKVLKNLYINAICDQLNNKTNPFYAAIEKNSDNIAGKNVIYTARYGINGGVGGGTEDGLLPISHGNNYQNLTVPLKNLYGTVSLSDKVIRTGRDTGAIVDVLNAELEGLLDAARFNFGRMLWQSGNGVVAKVGNLTGHTSTGNYPVDDIKNFTEGMVIDFVSATNDTVLSGGHSITKIDKANKKIYISPSVAGTVTIAQNDYITVQQSFGAEIFGIPYLFDNTINSFYGLTRSMVTYLLPQSTNLSSTISSNAIQTMLDDIDIATGGEVKMLVTNYAVRRKYIDYLQTTRTNVDYMNLDGGFKALSYNGIPLVADRFVPDNAIYFLNPDDFRLAQLCDWEWIEGENGRILMQLEKTPTYTGTLVKYANLICVRPHAQGKLYGITV